MSNNNNATNNSSTSKIIAKKRPIPFYFSILPNDLVNDPNISADAIAVMLYLNGKPNDWVPVVFDIKKRFGYGQRKWLKISAELVKLGVLKYSKHKEGTNLAWTGITHTSIPTNPIKHSAQMRSLNKKDIINNNKYHDHEVAHAEPLELSVVKEITPPLPASRSPVKTPSPFKPPIREPDQEKRPKKSSEQALRGGKYFRSTILTAMDAEKVALYDIFTKQLGINVDTALDLIKEIDIVTLQRVYSLSQDSSIINKGSWLRVTLTNALKAMKNNKSYNPRGSHNTDGFKGSKSDQKPVELPWEITQPSAAAKLKNEQTKFYIEQIHYNKLERRKNGVNHLADLCSGLLDGVLK